MGEMVAGLVGLAVVLMLVERCWGGLTVVAF